MDRKVGDVNIPIEILYLIEREPLSFIHLARILYAQREFFWDCVVEVLGVIPVLVPRELGGCVVNPTVDADATLLI